MLLLQQQPSEIQLTWLLQACNSASTVMLGQHYCCINSFSSFAFQVSRHVISHA